MPRITILYLLFFKKEFSVICLVDIRNWSLLRASRNLFDGFMGFDGLKTIWLWRTLQYSDNFYGLIIPQVSILRNNSRIKLQG